MGRGTADDWSDLDLACVVRDDGFGDWLRDLDGLYRSVGMPLLIGPLRDRHGEGEGRSQSALFAGPVALDLDVHPERSATRPVDTQIVFDRTATPILPPSQPDDAERNQLIEEALDFFWAMTPIALKYIGRHATARAVTQIDLLMDTFVRLWRLTHQPERFGAGGANWLHPAGDAELIRRLPRLEALIDPSQALDTVRSLMAQVSLLHPVIAERGMTIPTGAVQEVEAFLDAVNIIRTPHPGTAPLTE